MPLLPNCAMVLVDIETTGFKATDQIVQVAAKFHDQQFNVSMMPTVSFNAIASEKTGLKVQGGRLLYRGKAVQTTPPAIAAQSFIDFLRSCGPQVVLVGHNLVRFDAPRITKWLNELGLTRIFCDLVYGFVCTMPLIKQGRIRKQDELAKQFLTGPEWAEHIHKAHNAVNDCIILEGLLAHFGIDEPKLLSSAITCRDFFANMAKLKVCKNNLTALGELKGHVSASMQRKMASAGVTIAELLQEYNLNGRAGLEVCLAVRVNGKPRVTNRKNIIDKVEEFLKTKV